MSPGVNAATDRPGSASDQWSLTDALGRHAREYQDAGERKEDRFVGMFYWTWHQGYDFNDGKDDTSIEVKNITEVLRVHPEAINEYNHPAWGENGKRPGVFYWDEPIFGYYMTSDPWVLRKHAEMLADAGVDCVFFDCTNGTFLWEASLWPLLKTWDQAQRDGVNVPKISFLLPFAAGDNTNTSLRNLYSRLYGKNEYSNLWFYWKGKPLIMAYPDALGTAGTDKEIRDFFTFRPGQPDYVNGPQKGSDQWGWLEVYPTHPFRPDPQTGRAEQCTVGVAQNARAQSGGHCCAFTLSGTYGRSYSRLKGFDPRGDSYLYGWNFQEQWDRAIDEISPEMIFVTGWNEWTSGMWTKAHGWSDPLSFVDQFDQDHSRDIEPTRGWGDKGDVYYQQLVDNVRRFKGMEPPLQASEPKNIQLGKEGEWDDVAPEYKAYLGNTLHRDHSGRYNMYYTDSSGRNDITGAKVAHDSENVYFRVETASSLTPSSDHFWMMLLIDIDRDKSTGWNGYDFIVNRTSPTSDKVIIEKCIGKSWIWYKKGTCDYVVTDNVLEIAIPKSLIGVGNRPDFEFKWNDNMQKAGDILDFYISGDTAPGGRFNYVYTGVPSNGYDTSVPGTHVTDINALIVCQLGGNSVHIECENRYTITNLIGTIIYSGERSQTIQLPSSGVYIISSGRVSKKIIVK